MEDRNVMLKTKRIYKEADSEDGYRILVDRLWARGVSKEEAKVDYWAKEIAPSTATRKNFNHDADKFDDFQKEYLDELNTNEKSKQFMDLIKDKLRLGNVTLLYAAKNENMNNVIVLKKWIENQLSF